MLINFDSLVKIRAKLGKFNKFLLFIKISKTYKEIIRKL